MNIAQTAASNFMALSKNPYPGRGIVVGLSEDGEYLIQVYWIMGRSSNSRNRIFARGKDGLLFTEAADPSQVKDPSLIIYNAMREHSAHGVTVSVVSNGSQTDQIVDGFDEGRTFSETLRLCSYEPDSPNFTPRITACSYWQPSNKMPICRISVLRKSLWSHECDRHLYEFGDLGPGFGYCITTYSGDGNPLPSFQGEPYLIPLRGNGSSIIQSFWDALNADNRVALAVKAIPKDGKSSVTLVINKLQKTT